MKEVNSEGAPRPVGPYSQAVEAGGLVFCSGQIGLDPKSNVLMEGIKEQTRQAINNLASVLGAAGLTLRDVVKITVYLADMSDFQEMNEEYSKHFSKPFPARTTIQAASLPRNARIEVDAIAVKS